MDEDHAAKKLDCDIVMKGGITSGVVYPGAVVKLAARYRFRSIGGTSAGAIAAAIVAAAEHARQRNAPSGGFGAVAELPDELAQQRDGRPFMLQLFQPDAPTRPLFDMALGFLEGGPRGGLKATAKAFWRAPLAATAVAGLGAGLAVTGRVRPGTAVAAATGALPLLAGGVARDVLRAAKRLPANDFGLCRLGPDPAREDAPALTPWLHERIQRTAGLGPGEPVLSFADLWGAPSLPEDPERDPDGVATRRQELRRLSREPGERVIDLQMMTTDLTHGRPWRLPVPFQQHNDRLEDGGRLLFDPTELARFFPADVVAYLERAAAADPLTAETLETLERAGGKHLRRFPIGPDLPVVVATRMSLSFPVLISAVPLWELDYEQGAENARLRRVIFSDGGISSNFPVHLFDGPLPRRPTFGLHLTGFPTGAGPVPGDPSASVQAPPDANQQAPEEARPVESMGGFFVAIKDAMQNWRDNAQMRLPGFRDRVVHIRLASGEGGLNLAMDAEKILDLNARGAVAGDALLDRFADPTAGLAYAKHWDDHRFVRLRTTMSLLERTLKSFESAYLADAPLARSYEDRITGGSVAPYSFASQSRLAYAQSATAEYCSWVAEAVDTLDDPNVPRPPSSLRAVPPV
jgi:predicted acylesterase/phospholipase RssA